MAPSRLRVDGRQLRLPDGQPAQLRGFNIVFMLDTDFELPRRDTDDLLKQKLPGVNLLRLVVLHWNDHPTLASGNNKWNDCAATRHGESVSDRCLNQIDQVLRWAAKNGYWSILTARASIAAGEDVPGVRSRSIFEDAELRSRFLQVWRVVAQRYRKFEMVAGYEIMSEPRVEENEVDPEVVRDFFAEACRTVHQADPATPCVVGPAPFYHAAHLDRVYLRSNTNVIYVFNFFIPKAFVSGDDRKLRYPGMMRCCDVHDKATRYQQGLCCHNPKSPSQNCCDRKIWVGPELLDQALAAPVAWANTRNVPVIVDQWGVASSAGEGRLGYARDMMRAMRRHHLSWAYWQWRHRDDRPFAVVHLGYHGARSDDALIGVFASELGENVDEELRCYAARYPDLLAGFCGGDLDACEWGRLDDHWRLNGHPEGRVYGCDDAPPSPPLPADAQPAERFETAPCAWTAGLENLRARSTPVWCSEHNGDSDHCRRSFVEVEKGESKGEYSRCVYNSATKICYMSADLEDCPPPGVSLSPPPPPSMSPPPSPSPPPPTSTVAAVKSPAPAASSPPPPSRARLPPPPPPPAPPEPAGPSGRPSPPPPPPSQPGLPALSLELADGGAERPAAVETALSSFGIEPPGSPELVLAMLVAAAAALLLCACGVVCCLWRRCGRRGAGGGRRTARTAPSVGQSVRRRSRRGYSAAPGDEAPESPAPRGARPTKNGKGRIKVKRPAV